MTRACLHVFSSFAPGGPQVRTARLLASLGDEFSHGILALDGNLEARELVAGIPLVRVLEPFAKRGALGTLQGLRGVLRRERPDLVLTYNWGAIEAVLAARLAGLPVLHHEDGFGPDEVVAFKRRRVLARRMLLPGTRGVIVPSARLEELALGLWKLPRAKVHRVPNGLDAGGFGPADGNPSLRAEIGIPARAFVIGCVGHLRREKNPVRAVEAFAGLALDEETRLLVLGDGAERARVEQRARELGVERRTHFVGHQGSPGPFYRAMDAFLISSDTEQMPVALLEAMASALPVVATDVGDVRRVLPEEQGRFVVPLAGWATAGALAAALAGLARERASARALGAANRARVIERFSFAAMMEAYRTLYRGALHDAEP